jgi:hypothetical protein
MLRYEENFYVLDLLGSASLKLLTIRRTAGHDARIRARTYLPRAPPRPAITPQSPEVAR